MAGDAAGAGPVNDQEARLVSQPGGGLPGALDGLGRLFRLTAKKIVPEEEVIVVTAPAAHAAAPSAAGPSRLRLLRALPRSPVFSAVRRSSSSATDSGTSAGSGYGPLEIRAILSAGV